MQNPGFPKDKIPSFCFLYLIKNYDWEIKSFACWFLLSLYHYLFIFLLIIFFIIHTIFSYITILSFFLIFWYDIVIIFHFWLVFFACIEFKIFDPTNTNASIISAILLVVSRCLNSIITVIIIIIMKWHRFQREKVVKHRSTIAWWTRGNVLKARYEFPVIVIVVCLTCIYQRTWKSSSFGV